MGHTLLLDFF